MSATQFVQLDHSPHDTQITAPQLAPKHPAATRAARAHRLIARVLLGGLALQLFFAGLGVFGVYSFLPHAVLGSLVILTSVSLPLIAWRGHLGRAALGQSLLLAGLMILQGLLIDLGRVLPIVSALHPVNAMLLVLVTYHLATRDLNADRRDASGEAHA
jgi:hypothetical protein